MVKQKSSDKKGVKEVIVKKPKDAPITSAQPLEPETKPEIKTENIIDETKKVADALLKPIQQKDIIYTDTKPKQKRKKTKGKEPIEHGLPTKELQTIPEQKTRGNGFYIGLGFGIVIASVGIYYIYLKFKEWSKDPNRKEDQFINQIEKEGVKSIENIRKEQ